MVIHERVATYLSSLLADRQPSQTIDERLAKLVSVQVDLEAALTAVKELRESAAASKEEAETLQKSVQQLQQDREAAEQLAAVPQEAVAKAILRAIATGRGRGIVEGSTIGFVTGFLSSLLVWYLTTTS